jgi:methenyltetrahydromethanopterin cyclohydrolase
VAGASAADRAATERVRAESHPQEVDARIAALTAQGLGAKQVADTIAAETGVSRRDAYARVVGARKTGQR